MQLKQKSSQNHILALVYTICENGIEVHGRTKTSLLKCVVSNSCLKWEKIIQESVESILGTPTFKFIVYSYVVQKLCSKKF